MRHYARLYRLLGTAASPHPLRSVQPQFTRSWRGENSIYICDAIKLVIFIYPYIAAGVVRSSHVFGLLNRLHKFDSESFAVRRSKSGKPLTYSGKLINDFHAQAFLILSLRNRSPGMAHNILSRQNVEHLKLHRL